ncbi:hypothetical protein FPANT_2639 [Fusarium pseudoanthophilum]|uniref:Uncharacterized protein n=1 Tax=Fusarium pseudoanthophilum TaxID=48495 RepID=A0A8H5PNU3_9HYPO|nr:hypothetical protein FPANT_2639 [Fusarium pseudoanthophilum]
MITTLQKPFSQSHAVLRTGASVFSRLSRFHIANPLAHSPRRQWRPPIFRPQHQTRGIRTRPPLATPPSGVLSTDEKLDKLMASAARFKQEYKAAGSIKQRLVAFAKYRESLAQAAEREDPESLARKIIAEHEYELREAKIDGFVTCVSFIWYMFVIIAMFINLMRFLSKDDEEPPKPESRSLEEKDTPQASSTKTYRRKTNKAETETPGIKCSCHRPLELDNTRVL